MRKLKTTFNKLHTSTIAISFFWTTIVLCYIIGFIILTHSQLEDTIDINESSKLQLDVKSLIGIVAGIISLAGIWFTLTAEISQLQLDVVRMQDDVGLNHEFRVKWPRGEMGALPDDAKQDLKIDYLQKEVEYLRKVVKDLEIKQAKTE